MEDNSRGYVSVIGGNLIQPILDLVQSLESKSIVEPNEVQTGQEENGFSCAIVTLSVFLLESAFNRTKYVRNENDDKSDIVQYFFKFFDEANLTSNLDEIIALRDAIVHNHLWEANVYWDGTHSLKFKEPPRLIEVYGNKRQRRVMDISSRLSRRLKLNLFPPRIWRRDAYIAFYTVYKALARLEEIDHNYFTITYPHYMFTDQLQTIGQILASLPYLSEFG